MHESDEFVVSADLWLLIEQLEAFFFESFHFTSNVRYREGDMVNALTFAGYEFGPT